MSSPSSEGSTKLLPSSKQHPCPICGRTKDGSCSLSDSLVFCHHGSTHHPPAGLKPGDTHPGGDGQTWAYTGETTDGRCSTFTLDKPRAREQQQHQAPIPPAPTRGATTFWTYSPTFIVCRFPGETPTTKKVRPLTYDGNQWRWRKPPSPRPLLNLHDLLAHTTRPVLITEGEPACDAAARLLPTHVATTWSGGTSNIPATDYTPLAGRTCFLWPDADDVGRKAMAQLAGRLLALGCIVSIIEPPDGAPQGWDLANAADWSTQDVVDHIDGSVKPVIPADELETGNPVSAPAQPKPEKPATVTQPPQPSLQKAKATSTKQSSYEARNKRNLSHDKAMDCMDRCIKVQARQQRNSLRRRTRLLKVAKDLGLSRYIGRPEISERVLQAKTEEQGHIYKGLTAADRLAMPKPVLRWLVPGLIPDNDLTIIGGRAKVGKTRLVVAMAAAVLNGSDVFDYSAAQRPVILVTDDQGNADTNEMLEALNLWDHASLIWSPHFRLTEQNMDSLLDDIKANPGAMVILDSLRSISRDMEKGENDPEIGAILYDLKAAIIDAGSTLVLIHHCNKTEGLVGTEALSGHNAISGAANTILTLHYLPGDGGRPQKGIPERRLHREARSGAPLDWVITRHPSQPLFTKVMDYEAYKQQSKAEKRGEDRSAVQQEVFNLLGQNSAWMTRRQVTEALGEPWGEARGRSPRAKQIERALNALVEDGELEKVRTGAEHTWRMKHFSENLA